jgi:phosphoribosyl 1,2-cyclic phosphodiesterase
MRFCSLGSGSGGNATVVEAVDGVRSHRVVLDCGFSLREFESRLGRAGLQCDDLDAIFVTHEHGDHVGCAITLARRHGIPLWMSRGTWRAIGSPEVNGLLNFARDGEAIAVGSLQLKPYTVPHDAAEPLQLRCSDGAVHLGVLTDAGSATPHLLAHLHDCDALLLECNHDSEMLAGSRYPPSLKSRIGGPLGHLSNDTAAHILGECRRDRLQHLVAAHLSEQNNRPDLAREALSRACGSQPQDIVVADPASGFGWLSIR